MSASQLVRADLRAVYRRNVCFEGADLSNVILTHETLELSKRYNGAAFRSLSEASLDVVRQQLQDTFADNSLGQMIPIAIRPAHWIDCELREEDFDSAWRDWAAKHHPDVTIAPDYPRD